MSIAPPLMFRNRRGYFPELFDKIFFLEKFFEEKKFENVTEVYAGKVNVLFF